MKIAKFVVTILLASAFLLPPTVASADSLENIVFSDIERRIMKRYFDLKRPVATDEEADDSDDSGRGKKAKKHKKKKGKKKGLPPGLAKRKSLPPGLAKRASLPPGLARDELPKDLVRDLPPPIEGTKRVIVDDLTVVLVEEATGRVLDILEDMILGPRKN